MPAHRVSIIGALALLGACAHPRTGVTPGVGEAGVAEDKCLLSTGPVARHATITIGLTEPVDPRHVPFARNDAERLVFRELYETPARTDCEGHTLPELAGEWTKDDGGRRWTVRLRDGAQFWDGAPVTAQDVVFGRGGLGYTLSALDARTARAGTPWCSNLSPAAMHETCSMPGWICSSPAIARCAITEPRSRITRSSRCRGTGRTSTSPPTRAAPDSTAGASSSRCAPKRAVPKGEDGGST